MPLWAIHERLGHRLSRRGEWTRAAAHYEAALAEGPPRVHVRGFGPLKRPGAALDAATLGAAAAGYGVELGDHVLAALNGDQVARDPAEPLAEGDDVAFMAADAGG